MHKDVLGHDIEVGDKIGVTVATSSSFGHIRLATVYSLEPCFRVIWKGNIRPSNPLRFVKERIIVLP